MKRIFIILIALLAGVIPMWSQTWTGAINTSWDNPLNWSPNAVPGVNSNVSISNVGFSPKLQSNASVGLLNTSAGTTLDFNGFSLTVTSNLNGYNNLSGLTLINTNPSSDIVLNISTGTSGYNTNFQGCTVQDKITFNLSGSMDFYEGSTLNQYNGEVVYNVNGNLTTYLSYSVASQYSSHCTYNRTVGGTSSIFGTGATVGGNFTYSNALGGSTGFGNLTNTTTINGTCSISAIFPSPGSFSMHRMKNQTLGGVISIQGSLGGSVQRDTLKLNSFTMQGYTGSQYCYVFSNKIQGNVTIEDAVSYSSGYHTELRSNEFTGTTTFNHNGSNTFYESNNGSAAGTYIGNTFITIASTGNFYLSQAQKSTFTGNLTINRSGAGYTSLFASGATISGNLTFNQSSGGQNDLGNLTTATTVGGTVNMNVNSTPSSNFTIHRLLNQTAGGKMNIKNTQGFNLRNDSLIVDSLNIIGYRGNQYGYFFNNQINGHVTLTDSASYSSGYNTDLRSNVINGNTSMNSYGTNPVYEANTINSANTFNGNLNITVYGSGTLYTSHDAKSTVTGSMTVNRTGAGYTRLFEQGATIGGNFSFTKNSAGASDLGVAGSKTTIGGTINMNVNQTLADQFSIVRVINSISGGTVAIQNTRGMYILNDTLVTASFSATNIGGSGYAQIYDNQISGNLTVGDTSSWGGGYDMNIRNNIFTGNSTFNLKGTNTWVESSTALPNTFNGHVTYNISGSCNTYISHVGKSNYNGNLTIQRTAAGHTQLFNAGVNITGNLSLTKLVNGTTYLGNLANKSNIVGTLNLNIAQSTADPFSMHWLVNSAAGGNVQIAGSRAFDVRSDTMIVNNFNVVGYGGSAYAYFYSNKITGNVQLEDVASYGGGYNTNLQNNTIIGNTIYNILGTNIFVEASAANQGNTYTGNVTCSISGSGGFYFSHDATSTVNGNLSINRTVAGITDIFTNGCNISGNFTLTKNANGQSEIGSLSKKTSITGTVTMNITQSLADQFELYWMVNNTPGGSIAIQGSRGFVVQNDSLKLTTMNLFGYGGSAYSYLINNQIEGNLNTSDDVTYSGGYNTQLRNNTINGVSNFTINGPNEFYDGSSANYGNTYLGNVTYNQLNGAMHIGTGDTNSYAGNLTFNSSSLMDAEFFKFIGSTNTTINKTGTADALIQKLLLNKTGGAKVTLNSPLRISNLAQFNSGYIQSSIANPLIFQDNVTHTLSGDNSHVIGSIIKSGNDAFVFPLGTGVGIQTLGMTAPSTTTDSVRATIVLNDANLDGYNRSLKDASLINLIPYHYWTVQRISGANALTLSLGWSNPCVNAGITSLPALAVARWNGASWNNLGNSATTGTNALGTVTMTGTTTDYGPFILGSTTAANAWQVTATSATATTICSGQSTTLTGSGASTYSWMPGSLTGTSVVVSPTSTTTYTVTGTSATGCVTTATRTITVNPLPNVTTTTTAATICNGQSTSITASGANTYTWLPGSLTGATINVSPTSTTTYTVTGTTTATGCTKTATRIITVNPLPAVSTVATATTICAGQSTTITASNANTYTWMPGSLTGTSVTVSPASTTTYTVTGTTTATGCTNTSTRTITVNALPTITTSATATTICSGQSTSITASGGNTYTWMPGSLTGATVSVSPTSTTTYTITGTNTTTGCVNTTTRTITVNTLPNVSTSATATTICSGQSTSITATGANTYTWMPGSLTGATVNVTPTSTTTYTVTGTTTATGCTKTATRLITVNALPNVTTTATSTTICNGQSTAITASGANTYTWMPGSLTGATVTVAPATTTTYTVTGTTTATGCTKTATRVITVNNCNANLTVKAFIEGYYIGAGQMQPVLTNQGQSTTVANQCDVATIELHSATSPYPLVQTATVPILTNGTMNHTFNLVVGQSFYIAVKYRNGVQLWSANPVAMINTLTYDFTTAANKAFGNNQVQLATSVWGMYSGDINQDMAVDAFDYVLLDADLVAGASGYLNTDLNGDGSVDAFDYIIIDPNVTNGISAATP